MPSITSNLTVQSGFSPEAGGEFQSTLSAAVAVRSNSNYGAPQIKAKPQTPDAKAQASENKKKSAISESVSANNLLAAGEKPLSPDTPARFAATVPVIAVETPAQSSGQTSSGSPDAVNVAVTSGTLSSSLLSVSSAVQLPASVVFNGVNDQKVADGNLNLAAMSSKNAVPSVDSGAQGKVVDSNDSRPDPISTSSTMAELLPVGSSQMSGVQVVSAAGISQSITAKAASEGESAYAPKLANTSNLTSVTSVFDPTAAATQQASTAVAQSVDAPASLLDLSPTSGLPPVPAAMLNNSLNENKITDTINGGVSRQATLSAKGSSTSNASDARSKSSNSTTGDGPATGALASIASFTAKVSEAQATVNQSANGTTSASDAATLQQIAQLAAPGVTNHTPQTAQSVSIPAEATLPTAPVQAPQDSQAMQGVNSAQLIQSMRSSEMKLGMQSAEFGNISISTSLNHQALSAQISIDHLELGKALAVHLPAIEEKLGSAYGVQAKVELRDSNNPQSSNESGYSNSGQQSREQRQSQGGGATATQGAMFQRTVARTSFTTVSPTASASRLDIRI